MSRAAVARWQGALDLLRLVRRQPGITVRIGAVCLAGMVLMAWWTHWMYGSWNPRASYGATDLTDNSTITMIVNDADGGAPGMNRITDECKYDNNTAVTMVGMCAPPPK